MKWVAIVIGVLGIVGVGVALVLYAVVTATYEGNPVEEETFGTFSALALLPSQCANGVEDPAVSYSVEGSPCSEPHTAQAYAAFKLPGRRWPGVESVSRSARRECARRLRTDAPRVADAGARVVAFPPTRRTWDRDRGAVCVAVFDEPREGSALR